jgi:hypothetical protein
MVYSASQPPEVHVMRTLDGRRRRLVLSVGWRMTPQQILESARTLLTEDEHMELSEALGLTSLQDPAPLSRPATNSRS